MNHSDKIEQVSASLFAVQKNTELPKKDTKGQARGNKEYRYLALPGLIDHLKPHLKDAQLYVTQEVKGGQGFVEIVTTVWHLSGQFLEFGPTFMPAAGDAQQVGAAITYARRYALAAVFNVAADEDTDGRGTPLPSRVGSPASTSEAPASERSDGPRTGEGDGAVAATLATKQQWADLLSQTGGKTAGTADILNEKNGTAYTSYREAVAHATEAELAAVLP